MSKIIRIDRLIEMRYQECHFACIPIERCLYDDGTTKYRTAIVIENKCYRLFESGSKDAVAARQNELYANFYDIEKKLIALIKEARMEAKHDMLLRLGNL